MVEEARGHTSIHATQAAYARLAAAISRETANMFVPLFFRPPAKDVFSSRTPVGELPE
jgi:hypothetical protein